VQYLFKFSCFTTDGFLGLVQQQHVTSRCHSNPVKRFVMTSTLSRAKCVRHRECLLRSLEKKKSKCDLLRRDEIKNNESVFLHGIHFNRLLIPRLNSIQ
jgi:hypothetical protein